MRREQAPRPGGASASASTSPASEPPPGVVTRLAALRALYVPESVAKGQARLARERPESHRPFEIGVARRLLELRSLLHLAGYLHRAWPGERRGDVDKG